MAAFHHKYRVGIPPSLINIRGKLAVTTRCYRRPCVVCADRVLGGLAAAAAAQVLGWIQGRFVAAQR